MGDEGQGVAGKKCCIPIEAAFPLFQPWRETVSDPIEGRLQMLQIHQTGQANAQMDPKHSAGLGIEWHFHSNWNT